MKAKHFTYGMILILLTIGLESCTEIVEIELDSTYRRLVVYGEITSDSVHHQVELTSSSDYFLNEPAPKVSGALVELAFDDELITLEENDTLPGIYLIPDAFRGIPGETYSLTIRQVDIDEDGVDEVYQAESTMPGGLILDSINLSYFKSPFASGYQVLMYALDPPSREWYSFKIWKNSDLLTDTLIKYSVQPDDFINGIYIFGLPVGFLSDDDPREALIEGDTVTFELNSIDENYYNFVVDAQLEIFGNNPLFSGPPANVRSNIKEGGQGIFTAFSIQRISRLAPPPE